MNDVMKQLQVTWKTFGTLFYFQAQPKPQYKANYGEGSEKQEQQQEIIDFENGVIVKIYKSQVDPILVGGRLRRPQTKMGISSEPMTLLPSSA